MSQVLVNWVQFYCRSKEELDRYFAKISLTLTVSSAVLQDGSIEPQEADSYVGTANLITSALDITKFSLRYPRQQLLYSRCNCNISLPHNQSLVPSTAHPHAVIALFPPLQEHQFPISPLTTPPGFFWNPRQHIANVSVQLCPHPALAPTGLGLHNDSSMPLWETETALEGFAISLTCTTEVSLSWSIVPANSVRQNMLLSLPARAETAKNFHCRQ